MRVNRDSLAALLLILTLGLSPALARSSRYAASSKGRRIGRCWRLTASGTVVDVHRTIQVAEEFRPRRENGETPLISGKVSLQSSEHRLGRVAQPPTLFLSGMNSRSDDGWFRFGVACGALAAGSPERIHD